MRIKMADWASMRNMALVLEKIAAASFKLGVSATALIFLATLYELVARYFFGAPTAWALDYSSYLLCAAVFFTLPTITAQGSSIAISILVDMLAERYRPMLITMIEIVAGMSCVIVAALCFDFSLRQYDAGTLTLAVVPIPRWILTSIMTYGFLLSGTLHFQRAVLRSSSTHTAVL
ncbi:TRAP transporter small permease [Aquibium sp. LZ166]|uniref:TRAP transporter small permease protein n=1 Tax=Aquibium pacificus TaxID=3153579 RepID=A0ABV3SLT5_9HYPH